MAIQYAILLFYLCMETRTDVKRKEISLIHWMIVGSVLLLLACISRSISNIPGGIVPGILLMALSSITKGAIGFGDGMVMMLCGIVLGASKTCGLLIMALLLLVPFCLWQLVFRKASRTMEIAFLPFVLMAYLFIILIN